MPEFKPREIIETLHRAGVKYVVIGGLAAALHGADHITTDIDITPDPDVDNLERLASALDSLDAKIRSSAVPEGLAFDCSAEFLGRAQILNLTTKWGDLDVSVVPSGTHGYGDLRRDAVTITIGDAQVAIASLADVIRSKEAAGRAKDQLALPTLRRLLDEGRHLGSET